MEKVTHEMAVARIEFAYSVWRKVGIKKASIETGIPQSTIANWQKKFGWFVRKDRDAGPPTYMERWTCANCGHVGVRSVVIPRKRRVCESCRKLKRIRKPPKPKVERPARDGIFSAGTQAEKRFAEIGAIMGLSRERVRQIEFAAMRKFRRNWRLIYGKESPF